MAFLPLNSSFQLCMICSSLDGLYYNVIYEYLQPRGGQNAGLPHDPKIILNPPFHL
jgi:hypothetical protein